MRKDTLKIIDGLDPFLGVVINASTFNLECLNNNHTEIKAVLESLDGFLARLPESIDEHKLYASNSGRAAFELEVVERNLWILKELNLKLIDMKAEADNS